MSENKVFLDTNILVYGYDRSAGEKHDTAKRLLQELWENGNGVISTQILEELFVTVTKKIPNPLSATKAQSIVADFLKWNVVVITGELIQDAMNLHIKHKFSFWDCLVLVSAISEDVDTLYSEDLQDGIILEGVEIKNPFREKVIPKP